MTIINENIRQPNYLFFKGYDEISLYCHIKNCIIYSLPYTPQKLNRTSVYVTYVFGSSSKEVLISLPHICFTTLLSESSFLLLTIEQDLGDVFKVQLMTTS